MLTCNKCGTDNDADSNFCQNCGERLPSTSSSLGQTVSRGEPPSAAPEPNVALANPSTYEDVKAATAEVVSPPAQTALTITSQDTPGQSWKTVPESDLDLVGKGWKRFEEGDYAGALDLATQATRLDPNDHHAWALLGWANHRWGEHEQAIVCTRRAIQLRPNEASAYHDLGVIYQELEQWTEASREYDRASRIDPMQVLYRAKQAWALVQLGNTGEAIALLEQCANEQPDNPQVKFYLAYAYLQCTYRGWKQVLEDNEYFLPAGYYPTSLTQVLEAQEWVVKAERLNCQEKVIQDLIREQRAVISSCLQRKFDGSIITPIVGGLIWMYCFGIGLILAPLYFYVSRPRGYLINKRILSKSETADAAARGESGFYRLLAYALNGVFLPFMVVRNYIRNFTGEEKDIRTDASVTAADSFQHTAVAHESRPPSRDEDVRASVEDLPKAASRYDGRASVTNNTEEARRKLLRGSELLEKDPKVGVGLLLEALDLDAASVLLDVTTVLEHVGDQESLAKVLPYAERAYLADPTERSLKVAYLYCALAKATLAARGGRWDDVYAWGKRASDTLPESLAALGCVAMGGENCGTLVEAAQICEARVKDMHGPRDEERALYWSGRLWTLAAMQSARSDAYEELLGRAEPVLSQLVELDPNHTDGLVQLGKLRALQHNFDDVEAIERRLESLDPEKREDLRRFALGVAGAATGSEDGGIENAEEGDLRTPESQAASPSVVSTIDSQLIERRQLVQTQPEDAEAKSLLAFGLFNAIASAKAENQADMRDSLLDELRNLSNSYPEDEEVRDWLAKALGKSAEDAGEDGRPGIRDALIEELRQLSRSHPAESRLGRWLALSLKLAMNDADVEKRVDVRNALLDELRQLTHTYPQEAGVSEVFAGGLVHEMVDADTENRVHLLSGLLDELRQLSWAYPEDDEVRDQFALGLLCNALHAKELRDSSLEQLRELSRTYPQGIKLRESLAHGLYNAIHSACAEGQVEVGDGFLAELRQLAMSHPQEAVPRECYAHALYVNVVCLEKQEDLEVRDAILDELRQLARAFPDDKDVREHMGRSLQYACLAERCRGSEMFGELMVELRDWGDMPPRNSAVLEMFEKVFSSMLGKPT